MSERYQEQIKPPLTPFRALPITPAEEAIWRKECAPEEGWVEYSYADVRRLFATIDQARDMVRNLAARADRDGGHRQAKDLNLAATVERIDKVIADVYVRLDTQAKHISLLRSVLEEVDPFTLSAGDLCSKKDIEDAQRQRSLIYSALDDTK